MQDQRKLALGLARLEALHENLPNYIGVECVAQYHEIISSIQEAWGESLEVFKIPEDRINPRVTSIRIAGRHSPGQTRYSKEKYCDSDYFESQIGALKKYMAAMGESSKVHKPDTIRPYSPPQIHVENMYGSSIQHGSPGATANITFQNNDAPLLALLASIKGSIDQLQLNVSARNELAAEVQTIEAQIASPRPKTSVITECLRSAKTIIEGAAVKTISSGLVAAIGKFLPG
jgi:hypothetical protein